MENERDVPCSPKTLARRITATKSLFRWLHQYGVLVVDPAEKVAQRSAISPLPIVLTPEEYDAVLLAADRHRRGPKPDARSYTLVYLLLTTGIKKSETLGLKARTCRPGNTERAADLYSLCQPREPLQREKADPAR